MSEYKTADELIEAQQEARKRRVDREIRRIEAELSSGHTSLEIHYEETAEHFDKIGLETGEGYYKAYVVYATLKSPKKSWIKKLFSRG